MLLRIIFAQSEINHFNTCQIVLTIEHKILGFDISVGNLLGMKVFEGGKELLHDEGSHILRQVPLLNDVVEQFSSLAIFQNEEAHVVPLPNLVQLYDVWVVQYMQNVNLIDEGLKIFNFFLLNSLDGK